MTTPPPRRCTVCLAQPARVCSPCIGALVLRDFRATMRRPHEGRDCVLCEAGMAVYCGRCFVVDVTERRAKLRQVRDLDDWTNTPQIGANTP